MSNLAPGSLYDPAAPWREPAHGDRCPWNLDARSDQRVPTHACDNGHYFNLHLYAPMVAQAIADRRCPVFHWEDPDYDDGRCDGAIRELECACEEAAVGG